MYNLENDINKILSDMGEFDATKAETLRKEIVKMWADKNLVRAKLVFWIFFLLSVGIMIAGYNGLRSAADTRDIVRWAIFFMIGFNSTILMKLWYWVVDSKLNLLKELKQLELQIAELAGKNTRSEN
ncbi:MAG: hypothetical protein JSW23_02240 [Planctomycetota bacterium]|nr:MAG: hypothetical protein JSW23_02240 [Planctomycetota bacterium]